MLPDRKRCGRFEVWDLSLAHGENEIHAGLEKFKAKQASNYRRFKGVC
ncbi:MAG: hypothetical protein R2883_02705 [Caldisericia bacterium]